MKNLLLDNTPIQPSKFMTKNCNKVNDDARETFDIKSKINLKLQC